MKDVEEDVIGIGHNSAKGELKDIVDRIMNLEEERATVAADIKEVYAEAKEKGYDTKVLRKLIAVKKQDLKDRKARLEQQSLLETYMHALGMI